MSGARLAVLEDDTVLCTDCLHEREQEGLLERPGTIVHAWLADPAGEACECCGATVGVEGTGVS